jgi:hypothetical protein
MGYQTLKTSYPSDKSLQVDRQKLLTDVPRKGTQEMTDQAVETIGSVQPGMSDAPRTKVK